MTILAAQPDTHMPMPSLILWRAWCGVVGCEAVLAVLTMRILLFRLLRVDRTPGFCNRMLAVLLKPHTENRDLESSCGSEQGPSD